MTALTLLVGVVLGGLVVGLLAMQCEQRAMLERHASRLRELGEADVKVVEALDRADEALSTRADGFEATQREHADTLARLCSKAGVRFGKDG